jgi:hypothetical protein
MVSPSRKSCPPGYERIVGGFGDPSFGSAMMLRLGGVCRELLRAMRAETPARSRPALFKIC